MPEVSPEHNMLASPPISLSLSCSVSTMLLGYAQTLEWGNNVLVLLAYRNLLNAISPLGSFSAPNCACVPPLEVKAFAYMHYTLYANGEEHILASKPFVRAVPHALGARMLLHTQLSYSIFYVQRCSGSVKCNIKTSHSASSSSSSWTHRGSFHTFLPLVGYWKVAESAASTWRCSHGHDNGTHKSMLSNMLLRPIKEYTRQSNVQTIAIASDTSPNGIKCAYNHIECNAKCMNHSTWAGRRSIHHYEL